MNKRMSTGCCTAAYRKPLTPEIAKGLTPPNAAHLCQWIDAHPDVEFSTDELAAAVNISGFRAANT